MFKKIVLSIITILFFSNIISAQEVVSERSSLSSIFYIVILSVLIILGLIIFLIKKLNYNLNQILKSVGISLLITIGIEILFLVVSIFLPQPMCKMGVNCPTNIEILLSFSPYTVSTIFLITILIYYIIKFIKNK